MDFDLYNEDSVKKLFNIYLEQGSLRKTAEYTGLGRTSIKLAFVRFQLAYEKDKSKTIKKVRKIHGMKQPRPLTEEQRKEATRKRNITMLEKYGVLSTWSLPENQEKFKELNRKRYENYTDEQKQEITERIIKGQKKGVELKQQQFVERLKERLEKEECELLDDFHGVQNHKNGKYYFYKVKHKPCGHIFETDLRRDIKCPKCFHYNRYSNFEVEFKEFLNNLGVEHKDNRRFEHQFELDMYLPTYNIGIETNGTYWHTSEKLDKNYHIDKTNFFQERGIDIFHFWDYENIDIIKSVIRNKLGLSDKVYARNLYTTQLKTNEEKEFFENSHLSGYTKSSFNYALTDGKDVYACASFRHCSEGIELARYACKLNICVVGGFSKLLKYAEKYIKEVLKENHYITYCDRDVSPDYTKTGYYKNGFEFVGNTGSILKYYDSKHKIIYSRQQMQKHKLVDILPKFDPEKTAHENLFINKIYPVYNSGNWKFIKHL